MKPKAKSVGQRGASKTLAAVKEDTSSAPHDVTLNLGGFNADLQLRATTAHGELMDMEIYSNGAHLPAEQIQVIDEDDKSGDQSCSYIAPFDIKACRTALAFNGRYDSGFNVLRLDNSVQMSEAPVRESSVDQFRRFHLTGDLNTLIMESKWWVQLDASANLDDPHLMKLIDGGQMISAEEPRLGLVFQMHDDKDDADKCKQWLRICRQVTLRVIRAPKVHTWALRLTLRETVAQDFAVLGRSPLQFICEIATFTMILERKLGKQTPAQISAALTEHQKQGVLKISDLNLHAKSENSVEQALAVWRRGLQIGSVMQSCIAAESKGGSFWTELAKIHKFTLAASQHSPEFVSFCFDYVNLLYSCGDDSLKGLGVREIPDLVKKLKVKYDLKLFLNGGWLDKRGTTPPNKKLLRAVTVDINQFAAKCFSVRAPGKDGRSSVVDLTWQSVFDEVAEAIFTCWDLVYTSKRDELLDGSSGASPEELFADGGALHIFQETISELEDDDGEDESTDKKKKSDANAETSQEDADGDGEPAKPDAKKQKINDLTDNPLEALALVHVTPVPGKAMTTEQEKELRGHYAQAWQRKSKYIKFFEEKSTAGLLAAEMLKCVHVFGQDPMTPKADKNGFVPYLGLHLHSWQMGESITHPHNRRNSFQPTRHEKIIHASLITLGVKDELPSNAMFILPDAMKPGNRPLLLAPFHANVDQEAQRKKSLPRGEKHVVVVYDPAQLEERMGAVRGVNHCPYETNIHVTASAISVPIVEREYLLGDNRWNILQVARFTEWTDSWHLSFADKKKLYGNNRRDMDVVVRSVDDKRVRNNDDREPVGYNLQDEFYYHTLISDNNLDKFCSFSPLAGDAAVVCGELGIPFAGMVLSAFHKDALDAHCVHQLFRSMATEGNAIYEPALAKLLGTSLKVKMNLKTNDDSGTDVTPSKKARKAAPASPAGAAAKATPKATPKAAGKAAAAKAAAAKAEPPTKDALVDLINNLKATEKQGKAATAPADDHEDEDEDEEEDEDSEEEEDEVDDEEDV